MRPSSNRLRIIDSMLSRFVVAPGPFTIHRPHARSKASELFNDIVEGRHAKGQVDIKQVNDRKCALMPPGRSCYTSILT